MFFRLEGLRAIYFTLIKGTVSQDFDPLKGSKHFIWAPYEQAKTVLQTCLILQRSSMAKLENCMSVYS